MRMTKILITLLSGFLIAGCANLKAVRDFAGESAKFSAYTELTERFRDTYQRESPYLTGEADRIARENDTRRKAAYGDLLKIHQKLSLYMQTLAKLAGENTFDLSKQIDSLTDGIKAYPDLGIDKKHVTAAAEISGVIAKWLTSACQQETLREMVKEGDPQVQALLDGMTELVRCYRKTNENEKNTVLGFFEVEISYADDPKDRLLAALAREHGQAKALEYKNTRRKYDEAEKGIRLIAAGHRKLVENVDRLSADEVQSMISTVTKDMELIRENLEKIGS